MKLGIGLVAASLFGALAASPAASAMPVAPAPQVAPDVEQVRMVCDIYGRCWWRPNYYGYYGGPRRYYGPRYYGYAPRVYGPRYRYW
ncbi:hypothetical protein JQ596_24665 [Bradyrhizobium manausense]|uniref:hypothetical protein n=1 Tax=Bradyrhizobium TaxID=374 RepID=UPI001BA7238B|nr:MULTISPECIES: hypothetical protein [Bradyrhizobium]MBR0828734.1 hypothetical protein [Bradyrhizobium manausense]UVO32562.1 hypothetical protein KUF59_19000 [Bradyrhizobium arachidis]